MTRRPTIEERLVDEDRNRSMIKWEEKAGSKCKE